MRIKIYICLLLSSLVVSCNSKAKPVVYESKINYCYNLIAVDSLVYRFSEDNFISKIGIIEHWQNFILVEDRKKHCLWIFDDSLHYIRKIGKNGRGPGEYLACENILLTKDSLYVWDRMARKITVYNKSFEVARIFNSPPDILPMNSLISSSSKILKVGEKLIFSWLNLNGQKQVNTSDPSYLKENKSLCVLDAVFRYEKNILPWDDIYYSENHKKYTEQADMVSLAVGDKSAFWAQQHAKEFIYHFDSTLSMIKIFGRQPHHYQPPPNDKNAPVINGNNLKNYYDFLSNCTYYRALAYDSSNHLLLSYYATLTSKSWETADIVAFDKHYLQVYNDKYDCVLDTPIPGILKFVNDGKIYILTEDKTERFVIKVFSLQKK